MTFLTFFHKHGCGQDAVFWDIPLLHRGISFHSFWRHCNSEEKTHYSYFV